MTNPERTCPICLITDDHPRHGIEVVPGAFVDFHMDCCAAARSCDVCTGQLAGVGGISGNPKGDALREHLLTTGPAADLPGWTAPGDTVKG